MKTMNASAVRANLYKLMDEIEESSEPLQVTGKRSKVVMLSESDWHAIQETLFLLSIPGMRESIMEGMAEPVEQCHEDLEW